MTAAISNLAYLLAAVLFIFGLKRLSSPATARSGNMVASLGMLIAIVTTLLFEGILNWPMIIIGIVIGSTIGLTFAKTVTMTAMPQMVALLNGFGGGASAVVASAEYARYINAGGEIPLNFGIAIQLSIVIGWLTFSGS
ncbi:MAG: NAD(P)(+) transhydrogenase (Re/Si-specific) subunit beta, partial [Gemmatimonadota bacterium]|nr:NAD(P)(+) transhydrogenase (Re/Si-specific) subunit beta [Gemmatimonadota bacterium]